MLVRTDNCDRQTGKTVLVRQKSTSMQVYSWLFMLIGQAGETSWLGRQERQACRTGRRDKLAIQAGKTSWQDRQNNNMYGKYTSIRYTNEGGTRQTFRR